jgi:ribosome recycling factor
MGGTVPLKEIANVGPKPGDARALLISVYDPEVPSPPERALTG